MGSKSIFNRIGATYRIAAIAACILVVAGCGDSESDDVPPVGDTSLSIGGTPPSQILAGTQFSFTPTVTNPDGVALSFSATNLPRWASINSVTGQITGSPTGGDVGSYTGISITVSGGGASVTSATYSVEVVAVGTGSATLSWIAPTERTDGTPLTNLAGYRIYYGQSRNNMNRSVTVATVGVTTYVIDDLTAATWYFAVAAYDAAGLESTISNTVSKTVL